MSCEATQSQLCLEGCSSPETAPYYALNYKITNDNSIRCSLYSYVIFTSQQLRIGVKAGPLQVTSLQFLNQTADIDFLEKVAALCTESWKTALTCLVPWLGKTSDSDLIWTVSACNFISRTSLWLVNEALLDVEVLIFWHSCCPILAHLCLTYHINRSCLMLHSRPVWTHWGGSIVFFIHP